MSSQYNFTFSIAEDITLTENNVTTSTIRGKLTCIKNENINIFDEAISDVKAIIGENGAGKSTLIEVIVRNIMTKPSHYFDGFIVTDKFVFNRNGIDFGNSINNITCLNLLEVTNLDLVNFNRSEYQKKVIEKEMTSNLHGQIATSHLNNLTIIHYSPLLNIDRITNIEGVAGSSRIWETDSWHYLDFTTENCIVNDYNAFYIEGDTTQVSGDSELLAHKSAESKRNLELLVSSMSESLPFKNKINEVQISLNDFYKRFWESIDGYFKSDNEALGRITQVMSTIESKAFKGDDNLKQLESELYASFIYGSLKHEYLYRSRFGQYNKSNALLFTIELFLESTTDSIVYDSALRAFLLRADFASGFAEQLYNKIKKAIHYIINSKTITNRFSDGFTIPLKSKSTIKVFINKFFDEFINTLGDNKSVLFNIFSIDYAGLSSGEKSILSMFSRIRSAASTIPESQTEIMLLLDEPEVTLHPQWQTSFISILNNNLPKLLPNRSIQIIITSHSPILISDLPKSNVLFLEKDDKTGKCIISSLKNLDNTFAANIHSLYADAFFLKDKGGAMGQFAKSKIYEAIRLINNEDVNSIEYIRKIIEMTGEPLIKNQLNQLLYEKFPEEKIPDIDARIEFIEARLRDARRIKNKNNENNR